MLRWFLRKAPAAAVRRAARPVLFGTRATRPVIDEWLLLGWCAANDAMPEDCRSRRHHGR